MSFPLRPIRHVKKNFLTLEHRLSLEKIDTWSRNFQNYHGSFYYGIYVRGSVPLAASNRYSDLDVVVLFTHIGLKDADMVKQSIIALLKNYYWSFPVGIKVFNVLDDLAEPPMTYIPGAYELVRKYLNFEISASGLHIYGKKLHCSLDIYQSKNEFIYANQLIWGREIREMVNSIKTQGTLPEHYYYALIKKCIRLLAYQNLKDELLYYGTVQDCFHFLAKTKIPVMPEIKCVYRAFLMYHRYGRCDTDSAVLNEHIINISRLFPKV